MAMQRIRASLPSWDTTKKTSKKGFDKVWEGVDKLGAPVNKLTNKIGSEAFWPTTLDKESDKAARILKSFCKDGFYADDTTDAPQDGPKQQQRVIKKIPQKVIENAVGLAIFTTMRAGLWMSGAGGSGVLVARTEDGSWSPPSGIMLHTAGLGFLVGIDIYDCVLVINNRKALESFTRVRATVGGEISAVAGPVGVGGILENDGKWKEANRPVFTYLKSRGFYAGVQVDGTIVIERSDENEKFYGEKIPATDILAGKVRNPPTASYRRLTETLKAAEGSSDVDEGILRELDTEGTAADDRLFGVPEATDPDPYGFLALEKEGLHITDAGTHRRGASHDFEFHPSPKSPVYDKFHGFTSVDDRRRISGVSSSSSARHSMANYVAADAGTQTGDDLGLSKQQHSPTGGEVHGGITYFGPQPHDEEQHKATVDANGVGGEDAAVATTGGRNLTERKANGESTPRQAPDETDELVEGIKAVSLPEEASEAEGVKEDTTATEKETTKNIEI